MANGMNLRITNRVETPDQQEGNLEWGLRGAGRTIARAGEAAAGLPGDIANTIDAGRVYASNLDRTSEKPNDFDWQLFEKTGMPEFLQPEAKPVNYPGSEFIKENVTRPLTGSYLEPRTSGEKTYDRFVQEATDLINPIFGGLKKGTTAAQALTKIGKGIGLSALGNLGSVAVQNLGASKEAAEYGKLGFYMLSDLYGVKDSLKNLKKDSYTKAKEAIKAREGGVYESDFPKVREAYDKLKSETALGLGEGMNWKTEINKAVEPFGEKLRTTEKTKVKEFEKFESQTEHGISSENRNYERNTQEQSLKTESKESKELKAKIDMLEKEKYDLNLKKDKYEKLGKQKRSRKELSGKVSGKKSLETKDKINQKIDRIDKEITKYKEKEKSLTRREETKVKNIENVTENKIPITEVIQAKQDVNNLLYGPESYRLDETSKAVLEPFRKSLVDAIEEYGKLDPKFAEHYNVGEELTAAMGAKTRLGKIISKAGDIKGMNHLTKIAFLGGPYALLAHPGTVGNIAMGAAFGIGSKATYDFLKLIAKSPTARKAYSEALINAAKNKHSAVLSSVAKFDKVANRFDKNKNLNLRITNRS